MKIKSLYFLFLVLLLNAVSGSEAAVRFVSPSGDDANDMMSAETACSTLGKALAGLVPGDSVFILPGVYNVAKEEISGFDNPGPYAVVYHLSMKGEKGKPIVIKGLRDEAGNRPVFDFSGITLADDKNPSGYRITGFLVSGSYLKLSDFECRGIMVTRTDHSQSENIRISNGSYNTFDNIACHDGMGIGFFLNKNSHHNLIVNCDGYNNYDPISDIDPRTGMGSGGNNDAFGCHVKGGMDGNMFIGCRAWRNSDDGFDLINCYSPVAITYSIAVQSGYDGEGKSRADGNGFKAGGFNMKPRNVPLFNGKAPRHTVMNNFAAANKANGVYANHHLGGNDFIGNSSFDNRNFNYSMVNRKGKGKDENVDVKGYGHVLRGNLSGTTGKKHITWIEMPLEEDALFFADRNDAVALEPLLLPRLSNGMFSPETIKYIDSFRKDGFGADFSGYVKAISDARKISGADI